MTNKVNLTVKDINARVEKMAEDFQRGLQEFKNEFALIKGTPAVEYHSEFLEKFRLFESSVNSSLNELKADVNRLRIHQEEFKEKLMHLEMKRHYNYIIIHGLKDDNVDIYEKVLNLINSAIKIEVKKSDIKQCYRLGKKRDNSNRARPLAVQFCTLWMRDLVFFKKKCLKGSKVMITEMLKDDNLKLFKKCKEIMGNLVWTYRGLIYIGTDNGKVRITSETDLLKYQDASAAAM